MHNTDHGRQLTLNVLPHPDVTRRQTDGDATFLEGELKLTGALPVPRDLNPGARLLVTIADEDGEIITRGYYEVGGVGLVPIVDAKLGVIGTMRTHKAKRTDS